MQSLFLRGEVYGTTHLYSGQEAVAVGFASALARRRPRRLHLSRPRPPLARGAEPEALLAELLGRSTGINGGRAGSMNIVDPDHGLIGCFGIVGGSIAAATGAALALTGTRRDRGRILRRRRDEPGVLLRVPQLREGARPAGRLRLREQRLRRVHADGGRHGAADRRAGGGDGIADAPGRRDGRVGRPRVGARGDRARPRAAADRSSSRRGRTASSATRAATRASTGPPGELERWQERDPLIVAGRRLGAGDRRRGAAGHRGRRATAELERIERSALAAPFPEPRDYPEFKEAASG